MEGGVYLILYMVQKPAGPLSFIIKINICQGLLPQEEKEREREKKPRVQAYWWMEGKTELPLVRTDSCVPFPS